MHNKPNRGRVRDEFKERVKDHKPAQNDSQLKRELRQMLLEQDKLDMYSR